MWVLPTWLSCQGLNLLLHHLNQMPYEFTVGAQPGKERKRDFVDNPNGLFSAQASPKPPPAMYTIVEGMRVGGKRTVLVPPEKGYGQKGMNEIPPGATFELNIELLQVVTSDYMIQLHIISALTFRPLEHLHPLEYCGPPEAVTCFPGSTAELKNCSTGLELADVHNALMVEEASSLSVWTVACLCGTLRLENVLTFFAGVMLEKQIMVVSSNLICCAP